MAQPCASTTWSETVDLIAARTLPLPRILWIELTSRCPFDCVFCTRASLRGAGRHMAFDLYRRLIDELDRPQYLRLNYAGESGHYPALADAVALAARTGAQVELVSAIASLKPERLQSTLEAGLSRMTVSLHTLDAQRFAEIYRYSSLADLLARLEQLREWKARRGAGFALDLAFVAMQRNLDELPAIAEFAAQQGIEQLAVHPLIGRDPLPLGNAVEHTTTGSITDTFRAQLAAAVVEARERAPGVSLMLSSHELSPAAPLAAHPQPWPWPLPPGARIAGCDQSPFDSVHVLSDGRVIACEVTEKLVLGDLNRDTLREIWHGPAYRSFRQRHVDASEPACRECVYKQAYQPGRPQHRIDARTPPAAQLLRGWYADDGAGVRWSAASAALWLPGSHGPQYLHLRGLLATPRRDPVGSFEVRIDGRTAHRQPWLDTAAIDLRLPIDTSPDDTVLVEFACDGASSPHALGLGADVRELGFALISAETSG